MSFPTTHAALARALSARGYSVPTAVQLAVLEADAAGRDLLVSAQTGSGKTVAFGLALGPTILGEAERLDAAGPPLGLVIAPTRELAMQVCRELTWLYEGAGARIITCVGGMDVRSEARQLQSGAHIVVGTPGRLRDHIERGRLDLTQLKAAVLDEADEMLNLGFREDLEFILEATPASRRTLLFSATVPREIETLARSYQNDALRIQTIRRDEQHVDIDYIAHRVSPRDVEHAVVNVLRLYESRAALVFCTTREAVNRFSARLAERGFAAVALSGELTQTERTQALQSLRDGHARVLVATDVAARGLDLPDLALVIHAELPHDAETLLHRSGRTGRAGRKGTCVLIVPFNKQRKVESLIGGARLKLTWGPAPSPEDIRARDQERFLADERFTAPATDDELQRLASLQAARSSSEIALALLRIHDAQLPAPEDLMPDNGPPPRKEWRTRERGSQDRRPQFDRTDGKSYRREREGGPAQPRTREHATGAADEGRTSIRERSSAKRHDENGDMVWYRLNIGRERNADPRWLLPLICRAGGVTKAEIGAIRIEDRATRFQIAAEFAEQFDLSVRTIKNKEGHIVRDTGATDANPEPAKTRPVQNAPEGNEHSFKGKPGKPNWRDKEKGKGKRQGWAPRARSEGGSASKERAAPRRDAHAAGSPGFKKKHQGKPQS